MQTFNLSLLAAFLIRTRHRTTPRVPLFPLARFQPTLVAMADIFIMPASTARLAAANAPPRFSPYDEVAALLIGWSADRGNHRGANLDRMKAFWEFWGYGVNVIYADTIPYEAASSGPSDLMPIPIARGGVKASECGVTNKFMQMLSGGIKPKGGWGEERRKLLIVGYHGHGGPQTTPFNGNRIWLYGRSVILFPYPQKRKMCLQKEPILTRRTVTTFDIFR